MESRKKETYQKEAQIGQTNSAKNQLLLGTALAVCVGLVTTPSIAQSSGDEVAVADTIVVTARKREENAQTVPISLTVFGEEDIERKRLIDIEALEANTPGFTFDYLGGTKARPTIRGVGSDEPGAGGDASTVVFLDGVYQGRQGAAAVDIFDVQQIDILRGPQGTLWGKNAAGGAINVVTKKPTDDYEGEVQLTGGNRSTVEALGVVNIPLAENWNSRFAVSHKRNGGFVDNLFTGNSVYDTNRTSLRGHLAYDAGGRADFLLTADFTRDDSTGLPVIVTRSNGGADSAVGANGPFETQADKDGFAKREMYGVRGELNVDLGIGTFTSITAFRSLDDQTDEDWDGTNAINFPTVPQISFGFGDDSQAFSTENRLSGETGGVVWVAGLYYLNEDTSAFSSLGLNAAQFDWRTTNETNSVAVFGEVTIPLTDRFDVSGGVRYTDEEKEYRNTLLSGGVTQLFDTDDVVLADPSTDTNPSFDRVTWRASLDYQLTDEVFVYALASTGFKSGAFDSLAFSGAQAATPLLPEEVDNYELGAKTTLPNGMGTLNVTGFYMDYSNLQLVQFTGIGATGGLNLPSAKILGIEFESNLNLTENTALDLRYAFLDTDADSPEGGVIVTGRRLVRTAKHDFAASLNHSVPLEDDATIDFGANVSYRGQIFDDPDNNDLEVRPARTLLDTYLSYSPASERWRMSLWAKNLTNEDYVIRVSNIAAFNQVVVGPPRTFGVSLTASFN